MVVLQPFQKMVAIRAFNTTVSSRCETLLHLMDDIAMVKIGCSRIDYGCNYVVVLQPRLH
jgi:hypothetical protein